MSEKYPHKHIITLNTEEEERVQILVKAGWVIQQIFRIGLEQTERMNSKYEENKNTI